MEATELFINRKWQSQQTLLFAEVGLACETKYNAGRSKCTSTVRFFNAKYLFILHLNLQSFSMKILAFVTRPLLCWLGLGMRLVDNKIK